MCTILDFLILWNEKELGLHEFELRDLLRLILIVIVLPLEVLCDLRDLMTSVVAASIVIIRKLCFMIIIQFSTSAVFLC